MGEDLCRAAERGAQSAAAEVRAQRLQRRWATLIEMMRQRALAEVLAAAEIEVSESTSDAVVAADIWRARCAAAMEANEGRREEVTKLRSKAADLEMEVSHILAEFLALAWQTCSRP